MRRAALLLLVPAVALAGCAFPGMDEQPDDAQGEPAAGPRFLFALENGIAGIARAHLVVTSAGSDGVTEGNLTAEAMTTEQEVVPLVVNASHDVTIRYSTDSGGHASSGSLETRFDTSACDGLVRVTLRLVADESGRVLASANALCAV